MLPEIIGKLISTNDEYTRLKAGDEGQIVNISFFDKHGGINSKNTKKNITNRRIIRLYDSLYLIYNIIYPNQ